MAAPRLSRRKAGFPRPWVEIHGNLITFCSCNPPGTELERTSNERETTAMWLKDAAAGLGIVLFMVSAFVLASGASAFTA
jgi:hypothetical protein